MVLGDLVAALARKIFGKFSPHVGECLALREGLSLAHACDTKKFVVKSDALNMVRAIQKPLCRVLEANIIDDIQDLMMSFGSGIICYVSRDGNVVAQYLASYISFCFVDCIWIDSLLKRLGAFVRVDLAPFH